MRKPVREATLGEDDTVVAAFNHPSAKRLEARNPHLSEADLSFILHEFRSDEFLPDMLDLPRRGEIQRRLCAFQGPFLTFETLSEDLKVVIRIQKRLRFLLPHKQQHQNVRLYMVKYFRHRFAELYLNEPDATYWGTEEEFALKCYEMLFLHLLRTVASETCISRTNLDRLAERVFRNQQAESADMILTAAPEYCTSTSLDVQDMPIESRHGMSLFTHTEASRYLFRDQLQMPYSAGRFANPASLARDIACIFLYGAPAPTDGCSQRTCSSIVGAALPEISTASPQAPLPSLAHSSASCSRYSADVSASETAASTSRWSDPTVVTLGDYGRIERPWHVRSEHAELVEATLSTVSESPSVANDTSKRSRRSSILTQSNASNFLPSLQAARKVQKAARESSPSVGSIAGNRDHEERGTQRKIPVASSIYSSTQISSPPEVTPELRTALTVSKQAGKYADAGGNPFRSPGVETAAVPRKIIFTASKTENIKLEVMFTDYYIRAFCRSQMELDKGSYFWHWALDSTQNTQKVCFSSEDVINAIKHYKLNEMFVYSEVLGSMDGIETGAPNGRRQFKGTTKPV